MNSTGSMRSTILVVDDTLENLDVLISSMESFGFNFSVARSGEEMFRRLEQVLPALILLDIRMPGMDGFEACRRLKSDERLQHIPVIFMTALTEVADKVKGFELGAVDYITKPFQQEEVLARLKTHLTIHELQHDLRVKNERLQAALDRERKMLEDLRINISYSLPHELRTPLHAIIGFAGTILDAPELPKPALLKKYLTNIQLNGRRLQRLIENALLYAELKMLKYTDRTEKQRRQGEQYPFEITEVLEGLAWQAARANRREQDLKLELKRCRIRATPKHFNKIISELLENSFKFSQSGTAVQLRTEIEGGLCRISLRDRGRGMSAEQLETMDAYIQFERRKYEQQGLGLGMIVAQLLTSLEGGDFSIESEPEKGTTFRLVFQAEGDDSLSDFWLQNGQDAENGGEEEEGASEMPLPDRDVVKALFERVEMGDILGLKTMLQKLATESSQCLPFVRKLLPLVENIQLEQIRTLLLEYLA